MKPIISTYEVRGLTLAYHDFEPAGAPAASERPLLLLLHGFLDHGLSFLALARALGSHFRLIAPDFRGFGHSGWVGAGGYYYFSDYYSDLYKLIARLGVERFGLVGHSMGGGVAGALAGLLGDRVTGLILLEGLGPPVEEPSDVPARLKRWNAALRRPEFDLDAAGRRAGRRPMANVAEAADRLQRTNPHLGVERALELALTGTESVDVEDAGPHGPRVWRFDPLHKTPSPRPFDLEEASWLWRDITAPVLALYGQDSPWHLADIGARHRLMRSLRCGMVAAAGHNLHHDQPETIAAAVRHWFGSDRAAMLPAGITEVGFDLDPHPGAGFSRGSESA